MSEIPIREMTRNAVKALGGKANNAQIISWVTKNYGEKNNGTLRAQIIACSVNQPSRVYYPENSKPRDSDSRYDYFYSTGRGEVELYSIQKHGNWGITLHEGKPKITHEGKLVTNSDFEEFFFVEKDFQSTTKKKEDSQYLHQRFKILHETLKTRLGKPFNDSKSKVGHPFNQGSKEWRDYQWLTFARKGTFFQTIEDAIQFQVSLHPTDDLSIMVWLDDLAKETKKFAINTMRDNPKKFNELIQNLPPSYYVGAHTREDDYDEIMISKFDDEFREKLIERMSKKQGELYVVRYLSKDETIQYDTEIVEEISDTFEKLIPIAEFLGKSNPNAAVKAHSNFILTHYSDSKYDDVEGKQYQYDNNKPNSRKLIVGSKFVIQSKINNENYFVGYGKINNIEESQGTSDSGKPITKFVAKFSEYQKFESPKLRTPELYADMKSQKAYGSQPPSILPISRQLFAKIIGEDIEDIEGEKFEMVSNFANTLLKKKQLIFYGPPGTGKTYTATKLAKEIIQNNSSKSTLTFRAAAIKILQDEKSPMHYEEITKKVLDQGLVQTQGETPHFSLLKEMSYDIQKNGEFSIFKKIDKGTYSLNPNAELEELKESSKSQQQFIRNVTFHQSYSYEEFIEGIKPNSINGKVVYTIEPGMFRIICEEAAADPANKYVMIIDEINRGNISKIFGELITLIEKDKRGSHNLQLAYSKDTFTVPENIYIVGTMNTADRSLIQIDTALRRRFAFCELMPKPELLSKTIEGISLQKLLEEINKKIVEAGLREKQVGHSYLMRIDNVEDLQFAFVNEIVPLLQDYFFDDYKKLEEDILSSDFIDSEKMVIKDAWKQDSQVFLDSLKSTFQI